MKFPAGMILDALFPGHCAACGAPVSTGMYHVCRGCLEKISSISDGCNVCCGAMEDGNCTVCSNRKFYPAGNLTFFEYSGAVKKIIYAMKFRGIKNAFRSLMPIMSDRIREMSIDADIITYVPMNRRKLAGRGYNQSELIARDISALKKTPSLNLLYEKSGTSVQRNLNYAGRFLNVIDRYGIISNIRIKDRKILLVDDVFTTGATINECSRILLESGAQSVFSLTLARSDLKRLENI